VKLPVAATLEEKATRRRIAAKIRHATWRDIETQLHWQFAPGAMDANWNWLHLWLSALSRPDRFDCLSLVVASELHGLMSLDLRGRRTADGRSLIVDYLATNPSDRIEGEGFKYIGVSLMAAAVARSIDLGYAGRIWLESLADPTTLRFYRSLGMTRQRRRSAEGFDVFVFDQAGASEFLTSATKNEWIKITK